MGLIMQSTNRSITPQYMHLVPTFFSLNAASKTSAHLALFDFLRRAGEPSGHFLRYKTANFRFINYITRFSKTLKFFLH